MRSAVLENDWQAAVRRLTRDPMARGFVVMLGGSAAYGFSIGWMNSVTLAGRNALKFPMLIVMTTLVCSLAYFVVAQFLAGKVEFVRVAELTFRVFADLSLLLGSLSPACLFLASVMERPTPGHLHEYPLFFVFNVLLIGMAGALSLGRQRASIERSFRMKRSRASVLVSAWLALSLVVGGQSSWVMRPFFGTSCAAPESIPFFAGTARDPNGDSDFFQAVFRRVQLLFHGGDVR